MRDLDRLVGYCARSFVPDRYPFIPANSMNALNELADMKGALMLAREVLQRVADSNGPVSRLPEQIQKDVSVAITTITAVLGGEEQE